MSRDQALSELAQLAEELCDAHQHREVIWTRDRHRNRRMSHVHTTIQDGLLAQLREVASEGLKVADPTPSTGPAKSKPPGVFEALQRHVYIAVTAQQWATSLGLELRMTPEENIRGLVGKAANLDDATLDRLLREVRQWRRQAALATGWESQPFCPDVHCPNPKCRRRASIRIYSGEPRSAYCTNPDRGADGELICGMFWSGDAVLELATYVRGAVA